MHFLFSAVYSMHVLSSVVYGVVLRIRCSIRYRIRCKENSIISTKTLIKIQLRSSKNIEYITYLMMRRTLFICIFYFQLYTVCIFNFQLYMVPYTVQYNVEVTVLPKKLPLDVLPKQQILFSLQKISLLDLQNSLTFHSFSILLIE